MRSGKVTATVSGSTMWWAMVVLVALWQGLVAVEGVTVAPGQKAAMLAVNADWDALDWTSEKLDTIDCTMLTGVLGCNATGWVTKLALSTASTPAQFPADFADFEALTFLTTTSFAGSFPAFLLTMPSLEVLYISGSISGSLPADWSTATALTSLSFSGTISGPLPTILPPSLEVFDLSYNLGILSGIIPQAYLDHPTLKTLSLAQKGLSGVLPFPSNLATSKLTSYKIQRRAANAPADFIHGELPDDLFQWPTLRYLALEDVAISGAFPTAEIPVGCGLLQFSVFDWNTTSGGHVSYTGSIPPEIGRCVDMQEFMVWNAQMSGPLPQELLSLSKLSLLHLASNQFEGTLPTDWSGMNNLQALYLARNKFYGNIPASLGDLTKTKLLTEFYLDYNGFDLCGDENMSVMSSRMLGCNARFQNDTVPTCECIEKWRNCLDVCPVPVPEVYEPMTPEASTPLVASTPPEASTPPSNPSSGGTPPTAQVPTGSASVEHFNLPLAISVLMLIVCYLSF